MVKKGLLTILISLLLVSGVWATTTLTTHYSLPKPPLGTTGTADGYGTLMDSADTALYNAITGIRTPVTTALPSGSTPSLAAADSFTDSQTSDLTSPPIVSAVGTKKIIFFTAARAVRFDTSTTMKGNNSVSWTTAAGAWMELNSDGTYWRCAIHNAD